MKPIIVIPTYNERENISKLIPALFALSIPNLEIVVVDDNSPDDTAHAAQSLRAQFPVYVIKRPRKLGIGTAYIDGFKKALALGADIIFEMDADFSHNPVDVPRLITALENADLAIGSRRVSGGKFVGWGAYRYVTSWTAMTLARVILGLKTKDVTAGFRAFRRQTLETILERDIRSNGYAFQEEILFRVEKKGFRVVEIPVTFVNRTTGKSKLSQKDIWEFFRVMWRLRRKK